MFPTFPYKRKKNECWIETKDKKGTCNHQDPSRQTMGHKIRQNKLIVSTIIKGTRVFHLLLM